MRLISFVATRPVKFKPGAWLIMRSLGTDYSHVAVVFHGRDGRKYPYEANGHNGVNFVGYRIWAKRNHIVYEREVYLTQAQFEDILDYAMSICGTEYAFMQNVGIKVCEWIPLLKKNPFTSGQNCSELVKKIAELAGIDMPSDDNLVTPRQAIDTIRSHDFDHMEATQ